MPAPTHSRAVAQLIAAALLWSLGGLLIKSVDWPPLAVAGGRGIIAGVFLLLTHRGLRFRPSRDLFLGAFSYAACTLSFVAATKMTTAANAILLQYTAPVWIALFGSWFLGERATRVDWLTIVVVLGGMALFFADSGLALGNTLGNLMAIFSGLAFALMTMALRRQKDGSPVESIILGNFIGFVVGVPSMLTSPLPSAVGWARSPCWAWSSWAAPTGSTRAPSAASPLSRRCSSPSSSPCSTRSGFSLCAPSVPRPGRSWAASSCWVRSPAGRSGRSAGVLPGPDETAPLDRASLRRIS